MDDLALQPTSKKAIGLRLKLTRQVLGLDQGVFGSEAGIEKNTYNQYERGQRTPNLEKAIALCEKFHLTLDWIYRGDPSGLDYKLANQINQLRRESNTSTRD